MRINVLYELFQSHMAEETHYYQGEFCAFPSTESRSTGTGHDDDDNDEEIHIVASKSWWSLVQFELKLWLGLLSPPHILSSSLHQKLIPDFDGEGWKPGVLESLLQLYPHVCFLVWREKKEAHTEKILRVGTLQKSGISQFRQFMIQFLCYDKMNKRKAHFFQ